MRDCSIVTSRAFEGVMKHCEPMAAYNDNWRLYQNDFLVGELLAT